MIRTIGLATLVLGASAHALALHSEPVSASARSATAKRIEWAASYDDAFDIAVESKRVVFVAVNMDGERANDRMAEKVYKNKAVVALSTQTVNLIASAGTHSKKGKCSRFDCTSCAEHRLVDVTVRDRILKGDDSGGVIAPQHVFVSPGGDVLLSVPFEVSALELEWCFHEALEIQAGVEADKRDHPGRRPRRLIIGDVLNVGQNAAPITREEALAMIKEHKKGGDAAERNQVLRRLVTVDEPEAREYTLSMLRAGAGGSGRGGAGGRGGRGSGNDGSRLRGILIRWIGVISPQSYWEICAEFADSGAPSLQNEAVVALEQLAAEESLPMLMKAMRRAATDAGARKNLVRAIGTTARGDKKARNVILRASIDKKNAEVRANALIALGWLDPHEDVAQRLLEAALPKVHGAKAKIAPDEVTANERLGAVVAMGLSRDSTWTETLQSIADDEEDDEKLRNAARAAMAVIDGGTYSRLARYQKDAGSDKIDRERLFALKATAPRAPTDRGQD